ncbi:ornithine--oxo-acid transaminase [bacterium]|nr:ornithine--oxo-acid transaminase [bacterium]MCI0602762.1 ornithine--oxo-acid transaminase [bacterium]
MNTKSFVELEERYSARNYHPLDVVINRAEGVWVYDVEGNRYLDCLSAYSAVNQGHRHPRIMKALVEQAGKVTLTSRAFRNDQFGLFCKELCELTGYEMTLLMNSGAEAVETAVKTARKWGYVKKGIEKDKAEIIVCEDNFHGRTTTIISFSSEPQYREDFGPYTPGFKLIPYGDADALRKAITPNTAGFLVEPIQGESGVKFPPEGYLKRAAEICKENNVLFITDEIQSGLGRAGTMFAADYEGVHSDMVIIGKALGGGFYPISGVLASREILGVYRPGDHGSTFGGNPLACAVAREALKVIVEERLVEKSAELGKYFLNKVREIPSRYIKQVRGRGLFIGIDLKPEAGGARKFCEALKGRGMLCKETHEHVIRLAPPLVISQEEIDWACDQLRAVL